MNTIINRMMDGEQVNCYYDSYPDNYYNIKYSNLTGMFIQREYHNGELIETLSLCVVDVQEILDTCDYIHIK